MRLLVARVACSYVFAASVVGCAQAGGDASGDVDGGVRPDVSSDAAGDGATAGCDPTSDTCPSAQYCSPSLKKCVDGCRRDDACPGGKSHCDLATHVCQVCLTSDHCPAGQACSGNVCVPSCNDTRPCASGSTCCGAACVDLATNTANCGGCGTKCVVAGGVPSCVGGACKVGDCGAGYADCNGKLGDGCEIVLASDPNNCGKCGQVCGGAHASPSCASGACALTCAGGFGDCNGVSGDGCEADFAHDSKNCGACGATPKEVCNGVDDDCNGVCDDDVGGCRVVVERSYKASNGEHFYTTSDSEAHCCGFTFENPAAYYLYTATGPGLAPFYRCVLSAGYHFYTQNSACEGAGTMESIMGYIATSPTCGAVPLYRLANKKNGDHLYTTDAAEKAASLATYIDEGVVGYVWTRP